MKHKMFTELAGIDNFKSGQIQAINFILEQVKAELADFQNANVGYLLRETKKDFLYTGKMLIKAQIYANLIANLEQMKLDILGEEK